MTSRCEENLGGIIMLVDYLIFNPIDIKKDLISAVLLYIEGRVTYMDC